MSHALDGVTEYPRPENRGSDTHQKWVEEQALTKSFESI